METRSFDPYVEGEGSGVRRKVDVAQACVDRADRHLKRAVGKISFALPFGALAGYAWGYFSWSADRGRLENGHFWLFLVGCFMGLQLLGSACVDIWMSTTWTNAARDILNAANNTNNTQNKDDDGSE